MITDFSSINNIEDAASILGYTHFVSDSKKTKENELVIEESNDNKLKTILRGLNLPIENQIVSWE